MEDKVIKGQAYLFKDSLIQETITFRTGAKDCVSGTNVIIPNIWDDLESSSHEFKQVGKPDTETYNYYFFWEYEMNSIEDDNIVVKVRYNCPQPPTYITDKYLDTDIENLPNDYLRYWMIRLKTVLKNSENAMVVQRKEVTFNGCDYVGQKEVTVPIDPEDPESETVTYTTETTIELRPVTYRNNDIGDIANLLSLF